MISPLFITHYTLASALGCGIAATRAALLAEKSGLRVNDFAAAPLHTWIGRVDGVEDLALRPDLMRYDCRNNRLAQLCLEQDGFAQAVSAAQKKYGAGRIAVILGTSTSGILETEAAYRRRDSATGALPADFNFETTHSMNSVAEFVRCYLELQGPAFVISTACSSSAKVFASAARLIQTGICDAAVVGGVDSLCSMTLYGFNALQLVSAEPCRPCDRDRDGISIGEGAGFFLLEKEGGHLALLGYGESSDAYHMSTPHPEGLGAALAMDKSLAAAGLSPRDIDYINMHGTASRSNDSAEDQGMLRVFGAGTPCSSTKGATGHTLGAAGAVEAAISCICLSSGLIPGACTTHTLDPTLGSAIQLHNISRPLRRVMSNSLGFGGNNCSLIFGALA
jgi:3-oxoacyl-[acyl-carrier-protein] synthase-1